MNESHARTDGPTTPVLLTDGKPIAFADLKNQLTSLHSEELLRGLRLDQNNRWRLGQPIRVESYFEAFPVLGFDPERMLALIFGEVMLRLQLGEEPRLEEYQKRFPELRDRLASLFQLKQPPPMLSDEGSFSLTGPMKAQVPQPDGEGLHPALPGYEVLGMLGQGGMGVVYKARQTSLNRLVAVKMVLAGSYAAPEQMAAFRHEAELAARMQHPNIVQIFEVGAHAGHSFIAMEYVEGGSLGQKIGGNPQNPAWAAQVVETLARAVQEAHLKQIVHRDLKPANVLLNADGVPKIVDFGLARVMHPDTQISTTNAYMGTPCYMAPEQAEGRAMDIGPLTDVYSLGVILYELLAGQPPFRAASPWETMTQVRTMEPAPPSRSVPNVPRDLETICLKCLEKNPHARYASAAALADDLHRFRQGDPISARPIAATERAWRWCRRNPGWAAMFASSALLLLVIAVGASIGVVMLNARNEETKKEKDLAVAAKAEADDAKKKAQDETARANDQEKFAKKNEWLALIAEARGLRTSQRPGQRYASLAALEKALDLGKHLKLPEEQMNEVRDGVVAAVAVPDLWPAYPLPRAPEGIRAMDLDDSFQTLAFLDGEWFINVVRLRVHGTKVLDSKTLLRIASKEPDTKRLPPAVRLSRNGRYLAHRGEDGYFDVWDLQAVPPAPLFDTTGALDFEFHCDNKMIAVGFLDGRIGIYSLPSGKETRKIKTGGPPMRIAVHPQKQIIAYITPTGPTEIHDLKAKESQTITVAQPFRDIAWHPDGVHLLASIPAGIVVYDRHDPKAPTRFIPTSLGAASLSLSPAGDVVVTTGLDLDEVLLIDYPSGVTLFRTTAQRGHCERPFFDASGSFLAGLTHEGQETVWKIHTAPELRRLVHQGIPAWLLKAPHADTGKLDARGPQYLDVAVSPKQPRLVAVGMLEGLGLWDLETGSQLGFVKHDSCIRVRFEPSGDLLTTGKGGTYRWPLKEQDGAQRLGPPNFTDLPAGTDLALSASGEAMAVASFLPRPKESGLFAQLKGEKVRPLDVKQPYFAVALSPDARWLAAALGSPGRVRLLDLKGGPEKPGFASGAYPAFSPDGCWLALSGEAGRLYDLTKEAEGLTFNGLAAFTPDSQFLVAVATDGRIRLLDIARNQEVAVLDDPAHGRAERIVVTPDGGRILTVHNGPHGGVRIWDLRRIGDDVRRFALAWRGPTPPPAEKTSAPAVKILSGE